MIDTTATMAIVRGAAAKPLFVTLAARWGARLRLAGVVAEDHDFVDRVCTAGYLRNIRTGERFAMFQDAVADPAACHIDGGGVSAASVSVCRDIEAGCDLVLLSKFGKLEAAGGGLFDAFVTARDAGVPILTSISPRFESAWRCFAGPSFSVLAADAAFIETWVKTHRFPSPRPGAESEI